MTDRLGDGFGLGLGLGILMVPAVAILGVVIGLVTSGATAVAWTAALAGALVAACGGLLAALGHRQRSQAPLVGFLGPAVMAWTMIVSVADSLFLK